MNPTPPSNGPSPQPVYVPPAPPAPVATVAPQPQLAAPVHLYQPAAYPPAAANPPSAPQLPSVYDAAPIQPPPSRKQPATKRRPLVIAAIGLLFIGGAVAAIAVRQTADQQASINERDVSTPTISSAETSQGQTPAQPAAMPAVSPRTDGSLDLSQRVDLSDGLSPQDLDAAINDQINLSDGVSFMITGLEYGWSGGGSVKNFPGQELVKLDVVVGNRTEAQPYYLTSGFIKLQGQAGAPLLAYPISKADFPELIEARDIAAGEQVRGSIIYAIKAGDRGHRAVVAQQYNMTAGQTVRLNAKVALGQ